MPSGSRPAFSTYQQHYSPAKSALPKPPVPSARSSKPAAAAPEADTTINFEVAKSQIELLQLSLLHQASSKTAERYEASAERKLGRKQAKLRKEHEAIRAIETEQQRVANLQALEAWCHDPALLGEHLQILSKVYNELSAFTESGSRYAQLIAHFEDWVDRAAETSDPGAGFLSPLPPDWHKNHTSLSLRLRALQRDVEILPEAPRNAERPSSLEVLLDNCGKLLSGMLRELEVMTKLERGLLEQEKGRIEDEVKTLMWDGSLAEGGKEWVPSWRSGI